MIELGELEGAYPEFKRRQARVIAVSIEDQETSKRTQADVPHVLIVADADRKLIDAVKVLHPNSAPEGGDTAAPTTILVDGAGIVRWVFRPERFFTRLSPAEVLQAVDDHLVKR